MLFPCHGISMSSTLSLPSVFWLRPSGRLRREQWDCWYCWSNQHKCDTHQPWDCSATVRCCCPSTGTCWVNQHDQGKLTHFTGNWSSSPAGCQTSTARLLHFIKILGHYPQQLEKRNYETMQNLSEWTVYSQQRGQHPYLPNVPQVEDFLASLFDAGLSYSAINTARLSISVTDLGKSQIGSHPLVSCFMRGIFNQRPSLPPMPTLGMWRWYSSTWRPERPHQEASYAFSYFVRAADADAEQTLNGSRCTIVNCRCTIINCSSAVWNHTNPQQWDNQLVDQTCCPQLELMSLFSSLIAPMLPPLQQKNWVGCQLTSCFRFSALSGLMPRHLHSFMINLLQMKLL